MRSLGEAVETAEIVYLRVPFAEKDAAKARGCRWDPKRRLWFIPPHVSRDAARHWPVVQRVIPVDQRFWRASQARDDALRSTPPDRPTRNQPRLPEPVRVDRFGTVLTSADEGAA